MKRERERRSAHIFIILQLTKTDRLLLKQHSHCAQRCAAVRSAALRGTARRPAVPRSAAQHRATLRSVARRCAASRSAARHCAALPAIYLCKSYANVVNNQHGGHSSVFHRFLHAVTT